jgi:putative glycosyltransferase (TIGR04372 family)
MEVDEKWALCQRQSKIYLDMYWFHKGYNKTVCNDFLAEMTLRNLHVYPWVHPLFLWNQILPGGAIHHLPADYLRFYDIHSGQEQPHARLSFLPEEDARAKYWLRQQGWQEGDLFVCLLMRDNSYMDRTHPNMKPPHKEGIQYHPNNGYGWSQQNFRNSDIATYVPAAEWLADQGVWVIRMGKIMAKPIPSSHPRIIDYAFHPDRSDFLDIWLFAHCDLCISTGTGPDVISGIYQRPLLILNVMPLMFLYSFFNATNIPKTVVWQASGIPLNMREQLDNSIEDSEYYDRVGIKIIDLTPKEILASVQEQWQRLQGTWVDSEDDLERHHRFWEILKTHHDFHKYHGIIHPDARCGTIWLRSNGDVYLE